MSFWKNKRVLITGHTGFKGSWLAFWLTKMGASVCGYALEPDSEPNMFGVSGIESKIHSVIADIRNAETLEIVSTEFEPDVVFHLAAQSLVRRSYREPVDTYSTNVMGTINVLEAVRKTPSVKAAVIITTDKVYENEERIEPYVETEPLGGYDPYSSSKACAEIATAAYRRSFFDEADSLIATARAGNVIGGGDWSEDRLIPDVFRSLASGEKLVIRNPESVRPWQHVLEPLSGYIKLAEKLAAGERDFAQAWNFGPDPEDTKPVREVLEQIKEQWSGDISWEYAEEKQPHEAGLLSLNSRKANSALGWKSKLNLQEAVKMTAEWYETFFNDEGMADLTDRQIDFYTSK